MIPAGFVSALVTRAETKGSSQDIEDEFDALFARMNAGEGTQLVNASLNGKSFGFSVSMTVEEKFAAFGEALREINGTAVRMSYANFGNLQR